MATVDKVVLAYSGGLDTSVIVRWLQQTYDCEVVTFTADIGQGEEVEPARAKAQALGVEQIYIEDLREPFVGMEVTVREGQDGALAIRDSVMESVELGSGTYGDCVVTMSVDADITPTSADTAEGDAEIEISDPQGSDERCPILDSDPCTVSLTIAVAR